MLREPLLEPALLQRFRETEHFRWRSSQRALQHAAAIVDNTGGQRCAECWMANGQCICASVPRLAERLGDDELARVFLYTHYDEIHRRLSTNTGKLLQLVLGVEGVEQPLLQHARWQHRACSSA